MPFKDLTRRKEYNRRYKRNNPWLYSFYHAKRRCETPKCADYNNYGRRGIEFLLSVDEIKFIWFRDKAYNMTDPTIDRVEKCGNYQFNNCRFLERIENTRRATSKPISLFLLTHEFIKTYKSQTEAARDFTVSNATITRWLKRGTARGYILESTILGA